MTVFRKLFGHFIESDDVLPDEDGKRFWRNIQLLEGEEIQIAESWRPSFFLQSIFWWIATIMTLGLAMPFFAIARWARKRNSWTITNKRLLSRVGIFNRDSITIELTDVIDTRVIRPLATSFLGRGTIEIETRAGGEEPEMIIDFQHEPDDIRNKISEMIAALQTKKPQSQAEQIIEAILTANSIERAQHGSLIKQDIIDALLEVEAYKEYQRTNKNEREAK